NDPAPHRGGQLLALDEVSLEVDVELSGVNLDDALVRVLEPHVARDDDVAAPADQISDHVAAAGMAGHRRRGQARDEASANGAIAVGVRERATERAVAANLDADALVVALGERGQERGRRDEPPENDRLGADRVVAPTCLTHRFGGDGGDDTNLLV